MSGSGRLLVVGTPIGNLGDLAPRAAEALRSADLIVAEDTRLAARLLAHLEARVSTISFNEHNSAARLPALLSRLAAGGTLALTTDAGMPGVSDPGSRLVAAARESGAAVEVVPGPSAVTAAFALAGVEAPGFLFGGFVSARRAGERRTALQRLIDAARSTHLPVALYESPHRVRSLLNLLAEVAPGCQVALCRELTKLHEQVLVGTPAHVEAVLTEERGEFVLVISGLGEPVSGEAAELDLDGLLRAARAAELPNRTVVELLRGAGLNRREAYRLVESSKQSR